MCRNKKKLLISLKNLQNWGGGQHLVKQMLHFLKASLMNKADEHS